jgi:hydroxyacylglutathione hydrolase
MKLIPLPAFQDNYLWVLHDGQRALVVDPGDAQPVLACLQGERLQLDTILVTHHHPDHIGGVGELREATSAKVYGPMPERRVFDGTPAQMPASLGKLAALPGSTRVCCTHEYTLSNLKFARAVEPGNLKLINYQQRCEELRARNLPTLPSTIEQERDTHSCARAFWP